MSTIKTRVASASVRLSTGAPARCAYCGKKANGARRLWPATAFLDALRAEGVQLANDGHVMHLSCGNAASRARMELARAHRHF